MLYSDIHIIARGAVAMKRSWEGTCFSRLRIGKPVYNNKGTAGSGVFYWIRLYGNNEDPRPAVVKITTGQVTKLPV
jgi:hypothetical protein